MKAVFKPILRRLGVFAALLLLALAPALIVQTAERTGEREASVLGVSRAVNTSGPVRQTALEAETVRAVNALRRARGLKPLRHVAPLRRAAVAHSRDMASRGYFEHDSLNGAAWWKRIARFYPERKGRWAVGENLLWSETPLSGEEVVDAWLESPAHRDILLDPVWREVGLGVVRATAAGVYEGAEVWIWTADFGRR